MIVVDLGAPTLRIETLEDVLVHVRLAFDELDRPARALEEIDVTAAGEVDEALNGAAAAREIDEERRRHFVEIPRFIRRVLEVAFDGAGRGVNRDGRGRKQVVAFALRCNPWVAVSDAPVKEVRL